MDQCRKLDPNSNEYPLVRIGFDTEENEPRKVWDTESLPQNQLFTHLRPVVPQVVRRELHDAYRRADDRADQRVDVAAAEVVVGEVEEHDVPVLAPTSFSMHKLALLLLGELPLIRVQAMHRYRCSVQNSASCSFRKCSCLHCLVYRNTYVLDCKKYTIENTYLHPF